MSAENIYDNIKYLENKLKDNNLTISEYKKISDDIKQLRISLLKEQTELEDDKKKLELVKQDLLKIKINNLYSKELYL